MSDYAEKGHFPTLTPYIVVRDAAAALEFYKQALGAVVRDVANTPDGKIMNAQLVIGDSVLMLNDEFPDYGSLGPQQGERVHTTLHFASNDIDSDWNRAVAAGMTVTMPLENMFWGDRYGQLTDPFGYKWSMGQPISE